MKLELMIEMMVGLFLIVALALHLAAVGIIGLGVIILLTSFKGITDEHDLGDAFKEALPFTALLVVFFAVVSVIADQALFSPIIAYVLAQNLDVQAPIFFAASDRACAKLPEECVTTPLLRSSFDKLSIALAAPRILNAPIFWKFSHLKYSCA